MDWMRNAGDTTSTGTGPTGDHTTSGGAGYYLYTEASGANPGSTADLLSPTLTGGKPYCFSLATNMYGDGMGSVQILVEDQVTKKQTVMGLINQKDTSPVWRDHKLPIIAQPNNFKIVVHGVIGPDFKSDSAIDDLVITEGLC